MSEKKRETYIGLLQDLLKHEIMSIRHEAIFSEDAIEDILELLKKEPKRKKGKWQWLSSTADRNPCEMRYRCSQCYHEVITHGDELWENFLSQLWGRYER